MKKGIQYLATILIIALTSFRASAQFDVSITFGPPPLPMYEQPYCPGDGYLWIPGYWAYDDYNEDYYWVPGTWTLPPQYGYLWTPGYWGFNDGYYGWNEGYWAPEVGYYGGINYGYGYGGRGYCGGEWHGNTFYYNTAANHINT